MKKSLYMATTALLILVLLTACSVSEPKRVLAELAVSNSQIYENNINSILWFQKSGETRALYYQAFNLADMVVEKTLSEKTLAKKPAIVVDLDETMIDNSTYLATLALNGIEDLSYWGEWNEEMKATATPGAVEFLNKAVKKGVDVFYISNRYWENIESTQRNLIKLGFPQAEESHMLFRDKTDGPSKESRRQAVSKTHDIFLLMGDRLGDFSDIFEKPDEKNRNKAIDASKDKFGAQFIVLPNPMYGYWIDQAIDKDYPNMTAEQKRKARINVLKVWETDLIK
ncbi:MAG TPA: 5'-nucleotidase, lipoprotein e(P4) family [Bacillales bacterium]|nr:5'-nucleotidase, lipoprotein e(P4) family [Bacillales bacterium]